MGHKRAGIPNPSGVLTQEVKLSQQQDSEEVGTAFDNGCDDDMDVGWSMGDSEDPLTQEVDDQQPQPSLESFPENSYSAFLPLFRQVITSSRTLEDLKDLRSTLHAFDMRNSERFAAMTAAAPPQGMGSFPEVDRSRKDKRLTANSPNKRQRRS